MPIAGLLAKDIIQLQKLKNSYSYSSVFLQDYIIRIVHVKTIIYIGRIKHEHALG